ncbi:MAG: sulfurtransferase [Actinobacteria bacterium]|nr:sulfurtransferase [Actinomycetota bacterium]MCS5689425.1 rhodanese-like domain-containing protein [Acidimicrobiales bacterium]MEC8923361.1 rhodanese-like domain-containing protein [Actinomycetota bacterium]MEC9316271.1 rhodanese-like domain-containing protein [Actinomycetota bacterium]MED5551959.1 rhodanese-like domain-containing protein [Actinomycetota bacterium]
MEVPEIDVDELAPLIAAGARLLDVREIEEWQEARVPGGVLIPLGEIPDRVTEIPTDEPLYVICKSGGRSASACEFLRARAIDAVNVTGGTLAWIESGRDVESEST